MSNSTPNLNLFKYDVSTDANVPFSITEALNKNWDIIDEKYACLNNPYSLFDSKYSNHELNNLSWLKSEGQWNAKAVYTDAYDKLLKVYNGTETVEGLSVKLSIETYTDYDFVLNTADETFRLPLKTKLASGKAVVGNGMNLGLENLTTGVQANLQRMNVKISNSSVNNLIYSGIPSGDLYQEVGVSTNPTLSGIETSDSDLYLYYYVGETVQNANLIDAGRIGEQLATKTDMLQASGAGMPSSKYIDLTLGASGSSYTAPANGYFALHYITTSNLVNLYMYNPVTQLGDGNSVYTNGWDGYISIPVLKDDQVVVVWGGSVSANEFRFIYAEGEQ